LLNLLPIIVAPYTWVVALAICKEEYALSMLAFELY